MLLDASDMIDLRNNINKYSGKTLSKMRELKRYMLAIMKNKEARPCPRHKIRCDSV